MNRLLVVDDEAKIREVIREYSEFNGFEVTEAEDGMSAVGLVKLNDYDIIIMDVMMPKLDGFSACKEIKKIKDIPVIMLSARGEEYDKLFGFELGIDDYVTKPFRLRELTSRIRALLRRAGMAADDSGAFLNAEKLTARVEGGDVLLTPTEFQLLSVLVKNAGVIVPRGALLEKIWDIDGDFIDDNTLSVHVSRLREKIGKDRIETVRGVGYRYTEK